MAEGVGQSFKHPDGWGGGILLFPEDVPNFSLNLCAMAGLIGFVVCACPRPFHVPLYFKQCTFTHFFLTKYNRSLL